MATEDVPILSDHVYGGLMFFNAISGIALSLLGIPTNLLSIRTFLSMNVNDGVIVSFLSLSISDLASSILNWANCVAMVLHAYEHTSGNYVCYIDPLFFIIVFGNLCFMTYTITILNTLYIAITRCMCVVMPLRFRKIFTAKQSLIVAIMCALVPIAITTPVFTRIYLEPYQSNVHTLDCRRYDLTFPEDREEVKDVVYLIILTIIPFTSQIIVFLCMIVMVYIIRKARRIRHAIINAVSREDTVVNEKTDKLSTGTSENQSLFYKATRIVRFQVNLPRLQRSLNIQKHSKSDHTLSTNGSPVDKSISYTGKRRLTKITSFFSSKARVMDTIEEWVMGRSPEREKPSNASSMTATTDKKAKTPISHKESRVIEQVVVVCAIFFLCNLPMVCMGIATMAIPGLDASFRTDHYANTYYFLHYFRRVFEQFSSSINFFIYMRYNSKFRHLTCHFIRKMTLVKLVRGREAKDISLTDQISSCSSITMV